MICSKQYSSASQKGKVIKAERRGPTSPIPFSSLWIAMRTAYRRPCRTISYPRGNLSSQAHQVYCTVFERMPSHWGHEFKFFFFFLPLRRCRFLSFAARRPCFRPALVHGRDACTKRVRGFCSIRCRVVDVRFHCRLWG